MDRLHAMIGSKDAKIRMQTMRQSLWRAGNATVGTGTAMTAATTAFSSTAAMMGIYNSDTSVKKMWIEPLKLVLTVKAINTSGTSFHLTFAQDTGNRHGSAGAAFTPVQTAWADPVYQTGWANRTNYATIKFGALVLDAATAAVQYVADRQVSDVIGAADDQYIIEWGGSGFEGQTNRTWKINVPPMSIGPGADLLIHYWSPAASASIDPEWDFYFLQHPYPLE